MIKRLFFVILIIMLILVIAEIVLRLLGFGYSVFYKKNDKIRPGYRIFCVGESTTCGVGASNPEEHNYPRQLELILKEHYEDDDIQCFFDLGIGVNSSEMLLKMPDYIKRYRPSLIILMVGANNWWNLDKSNIILFNKNQYISNAALRCLIFMDRFRLWKLFKWVRMSLGLYSERCWLQHDTTKDEDLSEQKQTLYKMLAEHDIAEMVKICKASGIDVIISGYPMESGGLRFIDQEIAQTFDIPFVNNFELFRALPDLDLYISKDGWHPNERGYRLLADNIYRCIIKNRMIKW